MAKLRYQNYLHQLDLHPDWNPIKNMAEAELLFEGTGYEAKAREFVAPHHYAMDYLRAAPVLVLKPHQALTQMQKGAKLRDVMAAAKLPMPLRAVPASVIGSRTRQGILALATAPAATVGNVMKSQKNRLTTYLTTLQDWTMRLHNAPQKQAAILWAVTSMMNYAPGEGDEAVERRRELLNLADFARHAQALNPEWSWKRMKEESDIWHRTQRDAMAARECGFPLDHCIDRGNHEDAFRVGPYMFHSLRTPRDLMEEGQIMQHCVADYIRPVEAGHCHIFSIRNVGDQRCATLEVSRHWQMIQCQGSRNSDPRRRFPDIMQAVDYYIREHRHRADRRLRPLDHAIDVQGELMRARMRQIEGEIIRTLFTPQNLRAAGVDLIDNNNNPPTISAEGATDGQTRLT